MNRIRKALSNITIKKPNVSGLAGAAPSGSATSNIAGAASSAAPNRSSGNIADAFTGGTSGTRQVSGVGVDAPTIRQSGVSADAPTIRQSGVDVEAPPAVRARTDLEVSLDVNGLPKTRNLSPEDLNIRAEKQMNKYLKYTLYAGLAAGAGTLSYFIFDHLSQHLDYKDAVDDYQAELEGFLDLLSKLVTCIEDVDSDASYLCIMQMPEIPSERQLLNKTRMKQYSDGIETFLECCLKLFENIPEGEVYQEDVICYQYIRQIYNKLPIVPPEAPKTAIAPILDPITNVTRVIGRSAREFVAKPVIGAAGTFLDPFLNVLGHFKYYIIGIIAIIILITLLRLLR